MFTKNRDGLQVRRPISSNFWDDSEYPPFRMVIEDRRPKKSHDWARAKGEGRFDCAAIIVCPPRRGTDILSIKQRKAIWAPLAIHDPATIVRTIEKRVCYWYAALRKEGGPGLEIVVIERDGSLRDMREVIE